MEYNYTDKCREISGFGGEYEQRCREMVKRGMEWCDKNDVKDLSFHTHKNILGHINADNEKSLELEKYITEGIDCSGLMVQGVIQHIIFALNNGWEAYIKKMETST